MTLYKWSKTANSNDTIDSTINWAEGQSPGSVNNSSRAEMAAVAKYRDDTSGLLETAGSSDAYTLTTNQVFASLIDGMSVAFTASFTNTGAATLNVDGKGAKALVMWPGEDLIAGKLVEGGIYAATYNAADEEFRLHQPYPELRDEIPAGTAMLFAQASAPTGWTKDTTHNDKALRVVSGTPSSGGSTAFSTVFASRTPTGTVGGTTLNSTQIPSHEHFSVAFVDDENNVPVSNTDYVQRTGQGGSANARYSLSGTGTAAAAGRTSATGGGQSHTHSFTGDAMGFAVHYVDVMIATRDA